MSRFDLLCQVANAAPPEWQASLNEKEVLWFDFEEVREDGPSMVSLALNSDLEDAGAIIAMLEEIDRYGAGPSLSRDPDQIALYRFVCHFDPPEKLGARRYVNGASRAEAVARAFVRNKNTIKAGR